LKNTGKDIQSNAKALHTLRKEVEKAKIVLSNKKETTISIDKLIDGINFKETISRDYLNDLCKDILNKIINVI
jgi:molecular chaperone DnaK (HSP70)